MKLSGKTRVDLELRISKNISFVYFSWNCLAKLKYQSSTNWTGQLMQPFLTGKFHCQLRIVVRNDSFMGNIYKYLPRPLGTQVSSLSTKRKEIWVRSYFSDIFPVSEEAFLARFSVTRVTSETRNRNTRDARDARDAQVTHDWRPSQFLKTK